MSLTTERLHRLKSKGFDKFYTKHQAKWKQSAQKAAKYAKDITNDPRPADVSEVLQISLKIDAEFEGYMAGKSLREKYWVADFADYIIDQIYPPEKVK